MTLWNVSIRVWLKIRNIGHSLSLFEGYASIPIMGDNNAIRCDLFRISERLARLPW